MLPSADFLQRLESVFSNVWLASGGSEIMVTCPYCTYRGMQRPDTIGKLAINLSKNAAHCVRCDWGHRDASAWLKKRDIDAGVQTLSLSSMRQNFFAKDVQPEERWQTVEKPDNWRRMDKADFRIKSIFGVSLKNKKITWGEAKENKLYCIEKGKQRGYVVFPFFEQGNLVYWQGRAADPSIPDRWRKWNPDDLPLGKSYWLYGFDYKLDRGLPVYLVEGTLDKITTQTVLKRNGINAHVFSMQGTALSFPAEDKHPLNCQFGKLAWLQPSEVRIMLDPDATAKAEGLADILDMCGFQASAVRLSEDEGDPNEAQDKIINALGRAKQNKTDQLLQQIQMMTAPV